MNKSTVLELLLQYKRKTLDAFIDEAKSRAVSIVGKDNLDALTSLYTQTYEMQQSIMAQMRAEYPGMSKDKYRYSVPFTSGPKSITHDMESTLTSIVADTDPDFRNKRNEITDKFDSCMYTIRQTRSNATINKILKEIGLGEIHMDTGVPSTNIDYEFIKNAVLSLKALPAPVVESEEES